MSEGTEAARNAGRAGRRTTFPGCEGSTKPLDLEYRQIPEGPRPEGTSRGRPYGEQRSQP